MIIRVNGKRVDTEEVVFDTKVASIAATYDRHGRDYCIQLLNKDGYQIGDAIYVGDKYSKDEIVKDLKAEHGIK